VNCAVLIKSTSANMSHHYDRLPQDKDDLSKCLINFYSCFSGSSVNISR
jgi:hypothetical protein